MGKLGDVARRLYHWQDDLAEADLINERTAKVKKRLKESQDKLAFIKDPRNRVTTTREGIDTNLNEREKRSVGVGIKRARGEE